MEAKPQQLVTLGATLACNYGAAPALMVVMPDAVFGDTLPLATIMDFQPLEHIPSFGLCSSPANPEVAAATAAALGVPTPMPCVPVIIAPWAAGAPVVLIEGIPAVCSGATCQCVWLGEITILDPGQASLSTNA